MNAFFTALNAVTPAIEAMAGEPFSVIRNGIPGEYRAISIDEIEADSPHAMPGGRFHGITVRVFTWDSVMFAAKITSDTVLLVRGQRVRVTNNPVASDDGDNTVTFECGPVGIRM